MVRGISAADLHAASNVAQNIKGGSIAGFGQGEAGGEEVLVGQRLAQSLGVGPGDTISITSPSSGDTVMGALPIRKTYVVGGVFSVGMSEYDQTFIYMPLQQAQLFFGRDAAVDFIEIKVADPDRVAAIKPLVERAAGRGAVVTDWTDRNQSFFGALQVERNAMRLILMFVIFIAAMNVITGLIMLVKNKGADIAILRTMGAGQGAVLRILFMAGAVIGILGTLCGLVFGIVFCLNIETIQNALEWVTGTRVFNPDVYFLSHVPEKIDWTEVAIVSVFTLGASFVATLLPAWQASRIDPVEALRYE
jgi:lipoprotein-releasing system permease protein